jgi:hypothetical protein
MPESSCPFIFAHRCSSRTCLVPASHAERTWAFRTLQVSQLESPAPRPSPACQLVMPTSPSKLRRHASLVATLPSASRTSRTRATLTISGTLWSGARALCRRDAQQWPDVGMDVLLEASVTRLATFTREQLSRVPSFNFRRTVHLCPVCLHPSLRVDICSPVIHIRGLTMDAGHLFHSDGFRARRAVAPVCYRVTLLCPRSTHAQLTSPHLMRQGGNRPSRCTAVSRTLAQTPQPERQGGNRPL